MSLEPQVGSVVLGGITITADPVGYAFNPPARRSVFKGPGGWSTAQDFGVVMGDTMLELSSGDTGPLTSTKVAAIFALYRVKGQTYTLTDALGNEVTVLIMDFKWQHRFGDIWDYTMSLSVRAATRILGVAEV